MAVENSPRRYGHLEHEFAERFAEALAVDPAFRSWLLSHTKFKDRRSTQVLKGEMQALRTSKAAPWWKNYFTYSCNCFGCAGGRETDVFAVLEDETGDRFAVHVEIKQPTDRFNPLVEQAERYRARAACWAAATPPTVPRHSDACTLLLCSDSKCDDFTAEIEPFDAAITFEEIARSFPAATPLGSPEPAIAHYDSDFELGQRVFHEEFGHGTIAAIEGNKLEIDFEHAGRKKVLDSFVSAE